MSDPADAGDAPQGMRCDFCGKRVQRVRRVALDGGYERLQTRHQVQYACDACSQEKEAKRLQAQQAADRAQGDPT